MFSPEQLLILMQTLPSGWGLVAVNGEKAAYQSNWQHTPLTPAQIADEIRRNPHCQAVGVLCGTPSGGLLFVDHDGTSCDPLIERLSGLPLDQALPKTMSVTSGRPGRYQNIYRISEQYWDEIATKKIKTGAIGDDGKAEQLEFRWDGCQSVVVGAHPLTGCYQWVNAPANCAIAEAPLWMIEQMLKAPSVEKPSVMALGDVPLEVCLGRADRHFIQQGAPEGQRNDIGAKLARNLIGTANYLRSIGQRLAGEPWDLFEQFCDRCSPPIGDKERDQIWHSAEKSHPSASLSEDKIQNCLSAWNRKQAIRAVGSSNPPSPVAPDQAVKVVVDQTANEIRALLGQNLSDADLQTQKILLRSQGIASEREFNALWESIEADLEATASRPDRATEIDKLLQFGRSDLSLTALLPGGSMLPQLMARQAELLGSTEAAMLLTLLPIIATLAQVGTRLELIQATGFYALPILYTGVCGESGTAKSPTGKTILQPLFKLQADAEQAYQERVEEWKEEWKEAKANPEPGELPPPTPVPREYYVTDVTREAIALVQSQQPERGFLGYMDELSAVIGGQNQYRNGKGTDKEALLSGRDGTGLKVNRASGKRIFTAVSAYSITGGTQPDTLQHLMGDFTDGSGQWSRFLWTCLPVKPMVYPSPSESNIAEAIAEILYATYRQVDQFTPKTYTLSLEALDASKQWFGQLEQKRLAEARQALRSVYAKAKGNTGEVALLLHLLKAAIAQEEPADQVSLETFTAAITVIKHCLRQVQIIHSWGAETMGELPPALTRIIALSDRKGLISAGDVQAEVKALRQEKATKIRALFTELAHLGKGVTEGEGIRLKFRSTATTTFTDRAVFTGPITVHESVAKNEANRLIPEFTDFTDHFVEQDVLPKVASSDFADRAAFTDPITVHTSVAKTESSEAFPAFTDPTDQFLDQEALPATATPALVSEDSIQAVEGFQIWDTVEVSKDKLTPVLVQAVEANPDDHTIFGTTGQIEKLYSVKSRGLHSHYTALVRLAQGGIREFPTIFLKRLEVAHA
jgi:hypothetical protein